MPDEMVVQYCAPVLTGLKTANLFSFPFSDSAGMISDLRQLNQKLNHSVRVCPLGKKKDRTLIYMYRPADLREDLSRKEAREILELMKSDCSWAIRRKMSGDSSSIGHACTAACGRSTAMSMKQSPALKPTADARMRASCSWSAECPYASWQLEKQEKEITYEQSSSYLLESVRQH